MKKRILIIEDDIPTVDIYRTALGHKGFDVKIVMWGEKAVQEIKNIEKKLSKKPDLILLDLILPDMDGIDILKEIRKNESTKKIPVFILTNYTNIQVKKMGESLNAEKFLLKTDLIPSQLVEMVKKRIT